MEALLNLDGGALLWIQNNLRFDWMTPGVITITKLGNIGFIWICISLLLLIPRKTRWIGLAGMGAVALSFLCNNLILKNLVARTRPYEVIDGLILLTKKATDYSFPSGHSGTSFAAATAFFLMLRGSKFRWLPMVLAALIALSRLYIGIHYPSDVIGGAILGIVYGVISVWITGIVREYAKNKFRIHWGE